MDNRDERMKSLKELADEAEFGSLHSPHTRLEEAVYRSALAVCEEIREASERLMDDKVSEKFNAMMRERYRFKVSESLLRAGRERTSA